MSTIAENITRIQGAKNDIRTAIVGKGVDVPADAHIDEYAGYIQNIKTGGGEPSGKMMIPNGISLSGSTFTTLDMGNWDWSKVYDWSYMFASCSNLEAIENFPSDAELLSTNNMFYNCSGLTSVPQFNTSDITVMRSMFYNCGSLTSVPQFDTSNVTNMSYMLYGCSNLKTVPQFDTSNVTDMSYMFKNCSSLTSVPQFDTSNVTNTSYMFSECSSLTSFPQFDTSNVTDMSYMFKNCSNLTSVSSIDLSKTTTVKELFAGCGRLTEIRFLGNPVNMKTTTSAFYNINQEGVVYYPAEYEDAYSTLFINLPSRWAKIPE